MSHAEPGTGTPQRQYLQGRDRADIPGRQDRRRTNSGMGFSAAVTKCAWQCRRLRLSRHGPLPLTLERLAGGYRLQTSYHYSWFDALDLATQDTMTRSATWAATSVPEMGHHWSNPLDYLDYVVEHHSRGVNAPAIGNRRLQRMQAP
jgi:hypothetical protein